MGTYKGENMQTQHSVLGKRTDFYFPDRKLTVEVDENGHIDGDIDYELKRHKAIEKKVVINLLELILINFFLIFLRLSMKYLDTSKNLSKNQLKNQLKSL